MKIPIESGAGGLRPAADGGSAHGIAPPEYRLPGTLRLGRVVLQIADLERSLRYYVSVLGLRRLSGGQNWATLGAERGDRVLVELREEPGALPVPPRGRIGLYHFALLLPERAALGRFAAHVAATGCLGGASDHRVSEALYLQDPDGLGIEVYVDRPRSEWRSRGGQLEMATAPLDLAGLVAASGGEPWTGMPAGTVIGHIHLHVGEIDRAAQFYHQALGFDQTVWSYPGALFLSAGGYHHHLGLNTWAADTAPAAADEARLLEWEIVLPSVQELDAVVGNLEARGQGVEPVEGGARIVRDPWGTAVRLAVAPDGIG
jgi:catechol 2,3-dioxygenase